MNIRLKDVLIKNFKGVKESHYNFDADVVTVSGRNASGKTTIFDAFTWLLFGRDSLGNAKFEARPLDKDGKPIDNIEISVTCTLDINGKETVISKTQKQNWVLKRGSQERKFEGNVNIYEVDGYPRKEKEFKEFIASIIDEESFKMLTSTTHFVNLPWKEQRKVIMKLSNNVSDYDFAKSKGFVELAEEINKAPAIEDIRNKYQKSITGLKKKQIEIPVRIDEIQSRLVDVDVNELKDKQNEVIKYIDDHKKSIELINKEFNDLSALLINLKFEESEIIKSANKENVDKKTKILKEISEKSKMISSCEIAYADVSRNIANCLKTIEQLKKDKEAVGIYWKNCKSLKFDENTAICPHCEQKLPKNRIKLLSEKFEKDKMDKISKAESKGFAIRDEISELENKITEFEKASREISAKKKSLLKEIEELENLSKEIKDADLSANEEYINLRQKSKEIETQIQEFDLNGKIEVHENAVKELENSMYEFKDKMRDALMNEEIKSRVDELNNELKYVSQKILCSEKMIYQLEEFTKMKLEEISDGINSKFDNVSWKLFDRQINGGIKECCECTVNGVPYSSMNNGARVVAGLEIIRVLQKLFGGLYFPVFVDNAESVNSFNIPKMDCQLIKLKVTDDEELKIFTV